MKHFKKAIFYMAAGALISSYAMWTMSTCGKVNDLKSLKAKMCGKNL